MLKLYNVSLQKLTAPLLRAAAMGSAPSLTCAIDALADAPLLTDLEISSNTVMLKSELPSVKRYVSPHSKFDCLSLWSMH